MEKLKPCPFCNGSVEIEWDCLAEFPGFSHIYCLNCRFSFGSTTDEEELAEQWNTRTDNWISVKERLPDKGVLVLLYLQNANETKITTGKIFNDPTFEKGIGEFCIGFDLYYQNFCNLNMSPTGNHYPSHRKEK